VEQLKAITLNVIAGLITAGILALSTRVSWLLVNLAVLRLPKSDRQSVRSEWLAILADCSGQHEKLRQAISLVRALPETRRALLERRSPTLPERMHDNVIYLNPAIFPKAKPRQTRTAWALAVSILYALFVPGQIQRETLTLPPPVATYVASPSSVAGGLAQAPSFVAAENPWISANPTATFQVSPPSANLSFAEPSLLPKALQLADLNASLQTPNPALVNSNFADSTPFATDLISRTQQPDYLGRAGATSFLPKALQLVDLTGSVQTPNPALINLNFADSTGLSQPAFATDLISRTQQPDYLGQAGATSFLPKALQLVDLTGSVQTPNPALINLNFADSAGLSQPAFATDLISSTQQPDYLGRAASTGLLPKEFQLADLNASIQAPIPGPTILNFGDSTGLPQRVSATNWVSFTQHPDYLGQPGSTNP
jgi:hypothetical protein